MFPTELEIATQQQEMMRVAEQYRLARSLRDELGQSPSLWERLRARLTFQPFQPQIEPLTREAVVLSR
ncbi:MAG TPA: hypothetical protein VHD90_00205 [Phototrophicaceae bacterium]|nr:hypothetical protein [Phototrophicaceae bacterium]